MAFPDLQPCTPIPREHTTGSIATGAAGDVTGEGVGRRAYPGIEDVLHGAPCRLDRIGPLEQGSVANQTVVDQCLVADRRERRGIVAGGKTHFNAVDFDLRARAL